ncbi:MAG: GntR family transcriptional regulator [bacterium]
MATASDKLALRLDLRSHVPIFAQLVEGIRYHIASGKLVPGDQLPPVRKLAEELNINPNTVDKAYQELLRQQLVETQQGRGTFVRASSVPAATLADTEAKRQRTVHNFVTAMTDLGCSKSEILTALITQLNLE